MKQLRAAVRMFLFVASTLGLYSIWFIGSFFIPNRIYWRQIIFGSWAHAFTRIARMKVEIVGAAPRPPFFLVTNHLSYTDVAVIRHILNGVFVAKGEIESWFLAGRICRDMGAIFINRQNRRDIPRAGTDILKALERGEGVTVFPEGTSTKGEEVLKFNSSFLEFAAQSDLPVHYAAISYATPIGAAPPTETICWWDEKTFGEHLWALFQLKESTATVTFGEEPIRSANRKELAQNLWSAVSDKYVRVA
uniref:Acyltransferase domain protein n=1 Tax=Nostoc flagelliforme str. Sunitezuoqi TaxID=676037 RepID=E7DPH9_9NOSO|nr:acyltransferase domain protein [Nostoc flagelliforme str. Sunitezuoqi]